MNSRVKILLFIVATCWIKNELTKPMFVLVKGNLQGATKNPKVSKNKPESGSLSKLRISKRSFLESFQLITDSSELLTYSVAKNQGIRYRKAGDQFYKIHKDWIRTNQEQYYQFKC